MRKQPAWAFMLSNGHDQAHLHWNAGEPSLTVMCKGSETNVSIRLGEADAHAMALSLAKACGTKLTPKHAPCAIRPMGIAYTYDACLASTAGVDPLQGE